MRESGEALVRGSASARDSRSLISDAAMGRPRCRRRSWERTCWASISRGTWSHAGNRRAAEQGLTNLQVSGGRRDRPAASWRIRRSTSSSASSARCSPRSRSSVAKEMVRVTRPGGRIVMGNWIPGGSDAGGPDSQDQLELHAASARRVRQPDDVGRREPRHRALCCRRRYPSDRISFVRDTFTFNYAARRQRSSIEFRQYYGPTMNAFDAAGKNGRAADLQRELEGLFSSQNRVEGSTSIPATFLRVTVSR